MATQSRKKICVILGAGASNDVKGEGSAFINKGLRPPLARGLFDLAQHDEFRPILDEYEGAVVLAQGLATRSGNPDFDLEKELKRLATHPEDQIREHFKGIPPYLRDLLMMCSYNYTSYPSSYMELVKALLGEAPSDVLFLVLNYDDLLEQALDRYSTGEILFTTMGDYVRSDRSVRVVKFHGSINWFKLIGPASNGWKALLGGMDVLAKPQDDQIHVIGNRGGNRSRTYQIEFERNLVYPVLTAPLAGKGVAEMVCPADHLETAREFLVDCSRFLIIGSSGLDTDLLDILRASVAIKSPWAQFICGSGERGQEIRARFAAHVPIFGSVTKQGDDVAYDGGFASYVASDTLVNFLRAS